MGSPFNVHALAFAIAMTALTFSVFIPFSDPFWTAFLGDLGATFAFAAIGLFWYIDWRQLQEEFYHYLKTAFADYAGFWSALAILLAVLEKLSTR